MSARVVTMIFEPVGGLFHKIASGLHAPGWEEAELASAENALVYWSPARFFAKTSSGEVMIFFGKLRDAQTRCRERHLHRLVGCKRPIGR